MNIITILPVNHRGGDQQSIDVRKLPFERFLMRENISKTHRAVEEYFREINFSPTLTMELRGREAIKEAVAKGFGIGFMFKREAEGDSRIKAIPLKDSFITSTNSVVCLKKQLHRPVIKEIFQTAKRIAARISD